VVPTEEIKTAVDKRPAQPAQRKIDCPIRCKPQQRSELLINPQRNSEGELKMANSSGNEKPNKSQPDRCCPQKLDCLNYCVAGTLSRCGAGPEWQKQKKCIYYKRSSIRERCMHYIEALDGHCDCVAAQREVRRQQDPDEN
jgi:hypothetical protein